MSIEGESGSVRESLENAVVEVMTPQENSQETTPEVISAPETWGDEDKGRFEKISDADTRKWLVDLDKNWTTKSQETSTQLDEYNKLFEPHAERLKTANQSGPQVVEGLLKAQMVLESEKAVDGILWLLDHYKIDTNLVLEALGGTGKQEVKEDPLAELNPDLKTWLEDQLKPVQEFKTHQEKQQQEELLKVKQEADDAILSFKEEKNEQGELKYPLLKNKEVTDRIGYLIKHGLVDIAKAGGINPALKEAYEQACRALPSVRDQYMKSITVSVNKDRILNAKRAGAGLSGSGSSAPSQSATGSLRETLKTKMENASLL